MTQPRELYSFNSNSSGTYSVTSADEAQIYLGVTYTPITIGRNQISQDQELGKANINVTFDLDNVFANGWLTSQSDDVLTLTIFSIDIESQAVSVMWKGRLTSVKPDLSSITMVFESIFTSLRNAGLRAKFQLSCRFPLYGRGCYLNKSKFVYAVNVVAVSGNTVTLQNVPATPKGTTFIGGLLQFPDGTMRYILSYDLDLFTLIRNSVSLNNLVANGPVSCLLYYGCNRSLEMCNDVFNNTDNFGGFPFIPTTNPFGGASIV
jgi:hypothetical protein